MNSLRQRHAAVLGALVNGLTTEEGAGIVEPNVELDEVTEALSLHTTIHAATPRSICPNQLPPPTGSGLVPDCLEVRRLAWREHAARVARQRCIEETERLAASLQAGLIMKEVLRPLNEAPETGWPYNGEVDPETMANYQRVTNENVMIRAGLQTSIRAADMLNDGIGKIWNEMDAHVQPHAESCPIREPKPSTRVRRIVRWIRGF